MHFKKQSSIFNSFPVFLGQTEKQATSTLTAVFINVLMLLLRSSGFAKMNAAIFLYRAVTGMKTSKHFTRSVNTFLQRGGFDDY